jgi:hypothetical protein
MLRRTLIILIVLVVLLAAAALVVHLVLRSDFLSDVILARAGERIGMEVTAESVDVGWGGRTVIRDVAVRMPLTGEVILSARMVRLAHAAVPLLILGRPFHLGSVEIEDAELYARRNKSGRWNLEDVWARLHASLQPTEPSARRISLPRLMVRDARIQIAEPNEQVQTLGPLALTAQPQGRFIWTFDLTLPEVGEIKGQLAQGGDWGHEASFALKGLGPLVRDVFRQDLSPIALTGRWRGRVEGKGLKGRLQLDRADMGPAVFSADLRIDADANAVTVRPEQLVLSEPNAAGPELRVTSGTIQITPQAVIVEQLAAKAAALAGQLNGRWDLAARVGEFSGSWAANPAGSSQYSGTYRGMVKSPPLGRVQVEMTLTAQAQSPAGRWNVAAEIHGAGPNWQRSQWQILLPQLAGSWDKSGIDMAGTAATVDVNWPTLRLASLHLPDAGRTSAAAEFHADTRRWSAHIQAEDLQVEALGAGIDFLLIAEGDDRRAAISELRVQAGARVATVRGNLSLAERGFQDVSVSVDWPASASTQAPQPVQPLGMWHWQANATGRLQPLMLDMEGELTGRNVFVGKRLVPQVAIPLHAGADAQQIQVATERFDLLSGQWQASGHHDWATKQTQLALTIEHMSLEAAAGIARSPLMSHGTAEARMQLVMPGFDLQQAVATGQWSARDINIPPLRAETAHGRLRVAGGLVRFEDIEIEQWNGRAQAGVEFRLDKPQNLSVQFTTESWPVRIPDQSLMLFADSQGDLQINALTKSVQGRAHLAAEVLFRDWELVRLDATASMEGQTLRIREAHAEALVGTVEGSAEVPLDRWVDSSVALKWKGIRPHILEQWWPQFGRFEGEVSGSFVMERADTQARPLGPTRFVLDADIANGRYGSAEIELCRVVGYLSDERLLIEQASLQALGGRIDTRARVSRHAGQYYASLITDFNELSLNQIAHVIAPNAGKYAGLTAGRISLLSSSERLALAGEASIKLAQSDLVNNSVIGALHGILNLKIGETRPTGTGEIAIQFEGPAVVIPSFEYFNRGVEVRGAGRIGDIRLGADSPMDGYAVASSRVLKGIRLPGVRSLDRLMATLQEDAASVKIAGTVDEPEVKVVPLPVVSGSLRRLLWAQLHH